MHFRLLATFLILLSQYSFAQGRKPAVEDFVGIEIEDQESIPQGTEGLFNFEKDMETYKSPKKKEVSKTTTTDFSSHSSMGLLSIMAIAFIFCLPIASWFMAMNKFRQKAKEATASNIEILEKYRKEKEVARKAHEEIKKAS
jgi:hypothetical protein